MKLEELMGGRGFRTGGNVLRIGGNKFNDRKNEIPMKILEFERFGIRIIAEFRGIPSRFPNQGGVHLLVLHAERVAQNSEDLKHGPVEVTAFPK
jgi:hypothetical protein